MNLSISIHAPREGGDDHPPNDSPKDAISIHAPREGGDTRRYRGIEYPEQLSIHAPRVGGENVYTFDV